MHHSSIPCCKELVNPLSLKFLEEFCRIIKIFSTCLGKIFFPKNWSSLTGKPYMSVLWVRDCRSLCCIKFALWCLKIQLSANLSWGWWLISYSNLREILFFPPQSPTSSNFNPTPLEIYGNLSSRKPFRPPQTKVSAPNWSCSPPKDWLLTICTNSPVLYVPMWA